jgi:hypothetical protein
MSLVTDIVSFASTIRIGVYEFNMRAETAAHLPRYKGSTLRGAFGSTLKRVVCIRHDLNCEVCLVRPSCVYTQLFETLPPDGVDAFQGQKAGPHPYILEPPLDEQQHYAPDDTLTFGLTLLGRASDYLPYVIFSLDQAGQKGFGQGRGRFALASVGWRAADGMEPLIYDGAEKRMASGAFNQGADEFIRHRLTWPATPGIESRAIGIRFLTPTRIQSQGDLQGGMSFDLLMRNLLRRLWHVALTHGDGRFPLDHRALIERAQSVKVVANQLRWLDWERYSSRQKTKMRLGGLVGDVEYEFASMEDREVFVPLLILGELLHVGKNTTFGLGKFVAQLTGVEGGVNNER